MRELLQKLRPVTDRLSKLGNGDADGNSDGNVLAQHARNLIDEALSRSKWNKVADGLPVVPEGVTNVVIWVWGKHVPFPVMAWHAKSHGAESFGRFTHWQYRQDDTPAPPEDL